MRDYRDAKAMAKALRVALASRGTSITHSEVLEIVARQFGMASWNIMPAKIDGSGAAQDRGGIIEIDNAVIPPEFAAINHYGHGCG